MKRLFALIPIVCLALFSVAHAQRLDDDYVQIFNLIQEADSLSSAQPSRAMEKYAEAQKGLVRLQKGSPDWNPTVVAFRLNYVNSKIAALSSSLPAAAQPQVGAPTAAASPPTAAELENQLNSSKEQIRQLQADKGVLEAKLKEALAAQPAQVDPRELARAEERIKALQKENDLLKATVDLEKAKTVSPAKPLATEASQPSIAELNRQLVQQKELNSKLSLEKEALQSQLQQLKANTAATAAASATTGAEAARVKELERERDRLQKQLLDANKELASRKEKPSSRKVKDLENQVTDLRARLGTLEAQKVPYSAEELALFKPSPTELSSPDAKATNVVRSFPPGSGPLLTQAQKYFAAQQFDKAEATYQQVLELDKKNVPTLANLAAIQVEAKHFDDAQRNVQEALTVAPDDPYALYVLGLLKFQQAKYDEALDALSRSAKLDPQKAEVQNYLGLALSEKGLRGPAEAALRKAIELQPNYARAHYNLAIFYVTQQPKYPALARWHYQKALSAGFPRSSDLEKLLEDSK